MATRRRLSRIQRERDQDDEPHAHDRAPQGPQVTSPTATNPRLRRPRPPRRTPRCGRLSRAGSPNLGRRRLPRGDHPGRALDPRQRHPRATRQRAWEGHRAGQFIQLGVEIDGAWRERCYSPASIAGLGRDLELTVKSHPAGLVSNFLIEDAQPGMVVTLRQAAGEFRLPDRRPERILLISAGSGITPVMSMLRTLCAEGHGGPITFLHYAPDPEQSDLPRSARASCRSAIPTFAWCAPTPVPGEPGRSTDTSISPSSRWRSPATRRPRPSPAGRPACWRRSSGSGARRASNRGSTSRASSRRASRPTAAPREGEIHFAGSGVRAQNTGAALARTGRGGRAEPRSSAAGWASATPVRVARPRGRSRTSPPARSPPATTRRSRSACRHHSATWSSTSENRLPTGEMR